MPGKRKKKASLKVLQKKSTRLIRQEFMDYDYLEKLNDKDKQWLADFTDEFYNASVGKQKDKGKYNRFHKSKELVKERQDANNLRNNDVYGKARAGNKISHDVKANDPDLQSNINKDSVEDALIDLIDLKNKKS